MEMKEAFLNLSSQQLHRALRLKEQIEDLQSQLQTVLENSSASTGPRTSGTRASASARRSRKSRGRNGNSTLSTAETIIEQSETATQPAPSTGNKRKLSQEQRDKIAAAAKRRWKKAKAEGRKHL